MGKVIRPYLDNALRAAIKVHKQKAARILIMIMKTYAAIGHVKETQDIIHQLFLHRQGKNSAWAYLAIALAHQEGESGVHRLYEELCQLKRQHGPDKAHHYAPTLRFWAVWLDAASSAHPTRALHIWDHMSNLLIPPSMVHVNLLLKSTLPSLLSLDPQRDKLPSWEHIPLLKAWVRALKYPKDHLSSTLSWMHQSYSLAPDPTTWTTVTKALVVSGRVMEAQVLLQSLQSLSLSHPGPRAYTALIHGLLQQGEVQQAWDLVKRHLIPPPSSPRSPSFPSPLPFRSFRDPKRERYEDDFSLGWSMLLKALIRSGDLSNAKVVWSQASECKVSLGIEAVESLARAMCIRGFPGEAEDLFWSWIRSPSQPGSRKMCQSFRDILLIGYAKARNPGAVKRIAEESVMGRATMSSIAMLSTIRGLAGDQGYPNLFSPHNLTSFIPQENLILHASLIRRETSRYMARAGHLQRSLTLAGPEDTAIILAYLERADTAQWVLRIWSQYQQLLLTSLPDHPPLSLTEEQERDVRVIRLSLLRRLSRLRTLPPDLLSILSGSLGDVVPLRHTDFTGIISIYCRVGRMHEALHDILLKEMPRSKVQPTLFTWNTLADGYARIGETAKCDETIHMAEHTYGLPPDGISWNIRIKARWYQGLPGWKEEVRQLHQARAQAGWASDPWTYPIPDEE